LELTIEQLTEAFYYFDIDQSGVLEPNEMFKMAKVLNISEQKMQELIQVIDTNGDGDISFEEWSEYISKVFK